MLMTGYDCVLIEFYLNTGNELMGHHLPTPAIYFFPLICGILNYLSIFKF